MGLTDPTLTRVLALAGQTQAAYTAAASMAPPPRFAPDLMVTLRQAHQLAVACQADSFGVQDSMALHCRALAVHADAAWLMTFLREIKAKSVVHFDLLWTIQLADDIEQFGPRHLMEPALVRRIKRKAMTLQASIESLDAWPAIAAAV